MLLETASEYFDWMTATGVANLSFFGKIGVVIFHAMSDFRFLGRFFQNNGRNGKSYSDKGTTLEQRTTLWYIYVPARLLCTYMFIIDR